MTTYLARTKDGRTTHISALTYSDAYQQATSWAGGNMLESFNEV
jgi:hypothetical protein